MASDLITRTEYLAFTDQAVGDFDAPGLAQLDAVITAASDGIRQYANRKLSLTTEESQTPRIFRYYGGNSMDIDDCQSVTSVASVVTPANPVVRTLDASEWFALPDGDLPMVDFIEFWSPFIGRGSPEMGFRNNLDTLPYVPYPVMFTVDAVWGWPSIPQYVKQAAAWTVETYINFKGQQEVSSESIASFSRSFSQFGGSAGSTNSALVVQAIPDMAAALLQPLLRINV